MTPRGPLPRHARLTQVSVRLLALIFLLLNSSPSRAAERAGDYYQADVWNTENGLPSSSVTAIAQTPDGYLWVGTYNGLARFDGLRFTTFDPASTPALTHARVRRLFVDPRGTLWINTYDGSLTTLRGTKFTLELAGTGSDPEAIPVSATTNQITFLYQRGNLIRKNLNDPPTQGWETITPPSRITGALSCGDGDGNIWYRGRDTHLWRLHHGGFDLITETSGLFSQNIKCMTTDAHGRLWVGTDREIAVWDGTHFQNVTPTNATSPLNLNFLATTADNHYWAVADDSVYEGQDRRWLLETDSLQNIFTGNLSRMGAHEDHDGGVWLYDYGRGLFHVSADGQTLRLTPEDGFPGERVACFFEDREGNWWAGLDTGGLVRLRERTFQTVAAGDGTFAKAAKTVCEDSAGAVWIGTLGSGLMRWQSGSVSNVPLPGDTTAGFVFCACPDASGRLWTSVGDEDLFVLAQNKFKRILPAVHGVKSIFADNSGRIWVGTKGGLLVSENAQPENFQFQTGTPRRDVRAITQDKSGVVWAGAGDGGLYRIAQKSVTSFHPTDNSGSQEIWSLLAEDDGTVWAGTFRGGLLRFKDGQFTRYGKQAGFPDDAICQILADAQENLWLGSQHGIFRVPKSALNDFADGKIKTIPCTLYGRYDGLPSLECSGGYQPSAWRGHDGRLWFSTVKGVVSILPREIRPNLLPPLVALEDVLIDGKLQDAGDKMQSQPARAPSPATRAADFLEVPPGKRQFEFRYTGLSLVSPDRLQFRYRLEGLDEDWIDAGTRRTAEYSFLRPGTYRFCVLAGNSDGIWSETARALSLKILPPFFETWWFRTLAIILAIALVGGTARYLVTRRLRRELDRLEQQRAVERERTRIAKDIHDDLGAGLTQITLLSELARRDPPAEVVGHLGQISDAARELTSAMDEIVWAIDPENDTLDALVTYICKFAQEFLNVANIRCRLDLPEPLPPHPLRAEIRHNLFLAVKEALNNVVKHARATQVEVRLRLAPTSFTLVIEDNGQGFTPPANGAPRNGETNHQPGRTHSGHGLGNLARRLAASGGQCVIKSQPARGTTVELTINFDSPVLASPQTG